MDDENGGKAMNPMDSVFDLDALRAALPLGSKDLPLGIRNSLHESPLWVMCPSWDLMSSLGDLQDVCADQVRRVTASFYIERKIRDF